MKTNRPKKKDERLQTPLKAWKIDTPLPLGFQEQVGHRIERTETEPVASISVWTLVSQRHLDAGRLDRSTAHHNYAIAAIDQLGPAVAVAGSLRGFVMDPAVAEQADVRGIKEIWSTAGLGNGVMCLVGQAMEACGQSGEEFALGVRTGIRQRAQPSQVCVPVATGVRGIFPLTLT